MTFPLVLAVAVAGGVGSALRYLVDRAITARYSATFPWGTTLINLTGSLALGVVTGIASAGTFPESTVLGAGLFGGFTTFSTASLETLRLVQNCRFQPALFQSLGTLTASIMLTFAGFSLFA